MTNNFGTAYGFWLELKARAIGGALVEIQEKRESLMQKTKAALVKQPGMPLDRLRV